MAADGIRETDMGRAASNAGSTPISATREAHAFRLPDGAFEVYEAAADHRGLLYRSQGDLGDLHSRPNDALVTNRRARGDVKFPPYRDVRFAVTSARQTNHGAMITMQKASRTVRNRRDGRSWRLFTTNRVDQSSGTVPPVSTTDRTSAGERRGLRGMLPDRGRSYEDRPVAYPRSPAGDICGPRSLTAPRMWEPAAWMPPEGRAIAPQAWEALHANEWLTTTLFFRHPQRS